MENFKKTRGHSWKDIYWKEIELINRKPVICIKETNEVKELINKAVGYNKDEAKKPFVFGNPISDWQMYGKIKRRTDELYTKYDAGRKKCFDLVFNRLKIHCKFYNTIDEDYCFIINPVNKNFYEKVDLEKLDDFLLIEYQKLVDHWNEAILKVSVELKEFVNQLTKK